jgi:hypothetical protein
MGQADYDPQTRSLVAQGSDAEIEPATVLQQAIGTIACGYMFITLELKASPDLPTTDIGVTRSGQPTLLQLWFQINHSLR